MLYTVHCTRCYGIDQQRENVGGAQQADDTENTSAEHQQPSGEVGKEPDAVNALSEEESEAREDGNEESQERDRRRSTRTRKQPAWLKGGEYGKTIQKKQTKDLDWKQGEKFKLPPKYAFNGYL